MKSSSEEIVSPIQMFEFFRTVGDEYEPPNTEFLAGELAPEQWLAISKRLKRLLTIEDDPIAFIREVIRSNEVIEYFTHKPMFDSIRMAWHTGIDQRSEYPNNDLNEFVVWVLTPYILAKIANAFDLSDRSEGTKKELFIEMRNCLFGSIDLRCQSLIKLGFDRDTAKLIQGKFDPDIEWTVEEIEEWHSELSFKELIKFVLHPLMKSPGSIDQLIQRSGLKKRDQNTNLRTISKILNEIAACKIEDLSRDHTIALMKEAVEMINRLQGNR